ncbi:DNA mismatch repair endonuclease MutL [Butyrivibrio sp. CB08]|uniref:DNA mismatch repair endonuclease MutL n=1 Tax=Butyrivibrio sp. CB08 TaxID=2364879 RepID=UPI000EA8E408|nr:DNA mismatch repair endonuclease MutL [Butyrivibrio sp. CB08]RKM57481.1 DNA mismatch repair endonuclease MutL [Butyrivibrio sp. CB08]
MAIINELDKNTIDQIAAGEVVERPASVVKELVENAIDCGANAITVEIKGGGIDMIRVTDNGSGIEKSQIRKAFKRHATSKLTCIDDLYSIHSLGFRGEALSSISSVAQVDLITKTADELVGTRYCINGGEEAAFEDIGAPTGTTLIVRNLFYNTPARKKFLKTAQTEASYIGDVMEHMALDNPTISFHFINNKDDKFSTSGNGDLKEIIYRIYGRDISVSLIPINVSDKDMTLEGYLGEPVLNRSNRNFEIFFVNGRYIKDKVMSKALEEGYKEYLMQHKFPFAVLHLRLDPANVDVNVHPAKMEVRFGNQPQLYEFIRSSVESALRNHEMIPDALLSEKDDEAAAKEEMASFVEAAETPSDDGAKVQEKETVKEQAPEPFETLRFEEHKISKDTPVYARGVKSEPIKIEDSNKSAVWTRIFGDSDGAIAEKNENVSPIIKSENAIVVEKKPVQLDLFEEKVLTRDNVKDYEILGQLFGTYWIIAYKDKMLLVDQHAAHEKVNYERMIKRFKSGEMLSQMVNPPVIVALTSAEEELFLSYRQYFEKLGFNIENFGGREYAMRAIPIDLFGCENEKDMFIQILDELSHETSLDRTPDVINYKIASMACKASVKGNTRMSVMEMEALLDELLTLDNPYNCPHGRPTIISMTKYEIDKKFKRVVE